MAVENTKWTTERVSARCERRECGFRKVGSQSAAVSAAKRHVEETGHTVELSRSQWRLTMPEGGRR
jgi:hypothetical protein